MSEKELLFKSGTWASVITFAVLGFWFLYSLMV